MTLRAILGMTWFGCIDAVAANERWHRAPDPPAHSGVTGDPLVPESLPLDLTVIRSDEFPFLTPSMPGAIDSPRNVSALENQPADRGAKTEWIHSDLFPPEQAVCGEGGCDCVMPGDGTGPCGPLFTFPCEDCRLFSDSKLLHQFRNRSVFGWDQLTWSAGGELRYRFIDERNRLRPPVPAGRASYDQWRFTPFLQADYNGRVTGYVQAIDASTFGAELPVLPIDVNRADLLQYYVDLKLWELPSGDLRFRYGRQFLNYGSQRLVSPLAWANTFRNFEGYKLYFASEDWDVDAFAVQPVNGAAGNVFRPRSFDTPDQSRWFSGVYATNKQLPHSVLDLYWLWLREDEPKLDRIDGNRHTIGARWAGAFPMEDGAGDLSFTWNWDLEGAWQFGTENFLTGQRQDIQAGFAAIQAGPTLHQLPWTPRVSGIFHWGSGDRDPTDGTSRTVSTLFPLGHAWWGLIDNFSGQNLIDYGLEVTLKPISRLTLLSAWHWFDKAARQDAIFNIAGAPFGGTSTTARNIGHELDLVATYQMSANIQLQLGYFWFWYGPAVTENPNPAVANRSDAEQFYLMIDWAF